jgi:hypothetical protein
LDFVVREEKFYALGAERYGDGVFKFCGLGLFCHFSLGDRVTLSHERICGKAAFLATILLWVKGNAFEALCRRCAMMMRWSKVTGKFRKERAAA